jgi:hypothetical protein
MDAGGRLVVSVLALGLLAGCEHVPNYYKETGPSVTMDWQTPTEKDILANHECAPPRQRDWPMTVTSAEDGSVVHWPLYTEDPFEDKGHGRTDATHPHNVYRLGWEDWVAFPYGVSRFTLNWIAIPVSAIVTPPWTPMVSDSYLSKQALGYDHDATPLRNVQRQPPEPIESTEHEEEAEAASKPPIEAVE